MATEEPTFRQVRLTLSGEAIRRLASLQKAGAFRSLSAAAEEVIRAFYSVVSEYTGQALVSAREKRPLTTREIIEMSGVVLRYVYRFMPAEVYTALVRAQRKGR